MTLTNSDVQTRKNIILYITISQYISSVSPVSSTFVADHYPDNVSSATIRNSLAELEAEGLLTHPHTSAGRVPTEKGYRYFVDNLMHEIQLLEDEKKRVKVEYEMASLELEDLLINTTKFLAQITRYPSLISLDGNKRLIYQGTSYIVDYPDYQNIKKIGGILSALEQKETLLEIINQKLANKIEFFIGHEIDYEDIDECSLAVSSYRTRKGHSGRIAILGPTRMNYERVVSALDYVTQLIEEI